MTCDMRHMVGGKNSLKISARFGKDSVLKNIGLNDDSVSQSMSDRGVCITALAAPGLLNIKRSIISLWNLSELFFALNSSFHIKKDPIVHLLAYRKRKKTLTLLYIQRKL